MGVKCLLLLDHSRSNNYTWQTCYPNGLLSKVCGDFRKNALFDFMGKKLSKMAKKVKMAELASLYSR